MVQGSLRLEAGRRGRRLDVIALQARAGQGLLCLHEGGQHVELDSIELIQFGQGELMAIIVAVRDEPDAASGQAVQRRSDRMGALVQRAEDEASECFGDAIAKLFFRLGG